MYWNYDPKMTLILSTQCWCYNSIYYIDMTGIIVVGWDLPYFGLCQLVNSDQLCGLCWDSEHRCEVGGVEECYDHWSEEPACYQGSLCSRRRAVGDTLPHENLKLLCNNKTSEIIVQYTILLMKTVTLLSGTATPNYEIWFKKTVWLMSLSRYISLKKVPILQIYLYEKIV